MANEEIPCYMSKCLCGCGAIVFVTVDELDQSAARRKDTAKELAKLVRKGYTIERTTVGFARTAKFGCASKSTGEQK